MRLGEDSFLGEEIEDRMGKFRLQIGPLTQRTVSFPSPRNPNHQRLAFLTQFYLVEPLEYRIELILMRRGGKDRLSWRTKWSTLGWDTWIFSGDHLGEVNAVFPPQYRQGGRVMITVDIKTLLNRLNPYCTRSLEGRRVSASPAPITKSRWSIFWPSSWRNPSRIFLSSFASSISTRAG